MLFNRPIFTQIKTVLISFKSRKIWLITTQTLEFYFITNLVKMQLAAWSSSTIISLVTTACGAVQDYGKSQELLVLEQILVGQTWRARAANIHFGLALNKAIKDYLDCPLRLLSVGRISFLKMLMSATLCQLRHMLRPLRNLSTNLITTGPFSPDSSLSQQTLLTTLGSMFSTLSESSYLNNLPQILSLIYNFSK